MIRRHVCHRLADRVPRAFVPPCLPHALRRLPSAFSLVELLVVITLIGLLLAIAVPAVRSARHTARGSVCLANLRQIGVLLNAYLAEHEGVLPTLHNRESVDEALPALDTVLIDPGRSTRVMACPADASDLFARTGTSYFWNFTVNGQAVERLFSIIGGADVPRIPLVVDKEGFHLETPDRVNILYADGHAARELVFTVELP